MEAQQNPDVKESSPEKMPPPPSRAEQASIEREQEAKLRAKYPQAKNPLFGKGGPTPGGGGGNSAFLQKRLAKGQKYFDSGDYQMAKQKGPRGGGRLAISVLAQPPTGKTALKELCNV